MSQAAYGIGKVLENVEHKHETILLRWPEGRPKRADVNSALAAPSVADNVGLALDTLGLAEPREAIEREAIAAANVENVSEPSWRGQSAKLFEDEPLSRSPPPMVVVELAVPLGIFLMHRDRPFCRR